jgi:NADH dehydrogenase
MNAVTSDTRPHIVVLGAGFAGLAFCQAFPRDQARITLVDRTNHHLFQPLLYQVAGAGLAVPDIAQPIRSILRHRRDITVLMDDVERLDLEQRRVFGHQTTLEYDHLVVAVGGRTSHFNHPEWARHAPGLKTIEDALRIRRRVLGALERAEASDDPAERRRLLTTVVIGGGPTGVELAGACAELDRTVLARDFRRIDPSRGRVILIEAGPRLLPAFSPALSAAALRQLESLGVTVWLDTLVQDIRAKEVVLAGETIAAGTIVWAAGVAASPLTAQLGAPLDRAGRVKVEPDLTLQGRPEVRVLGDLVSLIDARGTPVPGLSPAAMQMGRYAAAEIAASLRTGTQRERLTDRPPFLYRDKGTMATVGRRRAVARVWGLDWTGMPAWLLWLFVHLLFLIGFRNRLSVFISWVYSYFTYERGARVIYGGNCSPAPAKTSAPAATVAPPTPRP